MKDSFIILSKWVFCNDNICVLGLQMGKMQSRVGLAMILKDFSFSTTPETPLEMKPIYGQVLINPSKPIVLSVQKVK